ncbi:unnamed protein product [Parajaminaea phylloscopi]
MSKTIDSLTLALEPPPAHPDDDGPLEKPLSERLLRLWTERGDFSKFSLAELSDGGHDRPIEDKFPGRPELEIAWGPDGEAALQQQQQQPNQAGNGGDDGRQAQDIDTSPMTMEEFVALKEEMMGKIHVAQQSLYSSQALVSLLVAAQKSKPGSAASTSTAAGQGILDSLTATRAPSHTASRAASPGAASNASGTDGGRQAGQTQSNGPTQPPPPGSVAAVEAEFGMDPFSIALTGIDRLEVVEEPRAAEEQEADDGDDISTRKRDDFDRLTFASDAERAEYTKRAQLVLAQKRSAMQKTIDILRAGARHLGGGEESGSATVADSIRAASSSTSSATRQRWEALREAQRNAWGLTPGRPERSEWWGRRQQRADEGEQDVWIGYAVPEARPMYARRGLAYMQRGTAALESSGQHHGSNRQESGATDDGKMLTSSAELVFAARAHRRLEISMRTTQTDGTVRRRRAPWRLAADAAPSDNTKPDVHTRLQAAQDELVDVELFDDLSAEARMLAADGVLQCQSTDESICISLSSTGPDLILELRPTEDAQDTDDDVAVDVAEEDVLLGLLRSFMLFSLVKRYQHRANAEQAERRKAALASRAREGTHPAAPASSSGGKPANSAANPVAGSAKAGTSASKRTRMDLWEGAPCLMPVVGLLHYATFVTQIRSAVQETIEGYARQASGVENAHAETVEFAFEMDAAKSVANASDWLSSVIDLAGASRPATSAGGGGQRPGDLTAAKAFTTASGVPSATAMAIQSLGGTATVTASTKLPTASADSVVPPSPLTGAGQEKVVLAHLTMSYPSNLTVQLPWRLTLSGDLGVTMHQVEIGQRRSEGLTSRRGARADPADAVDLRSMIAAELVASLKRFEVKTAQRASEAK